MKYDEIAEAVREHHDRVLVTGEILPPESNLEHGDLIAAFGNVRGMLSYVINGIHTLEELTLEPADWSPRKLTRLERVRDASALTYTEELLEAIKTLRLEVAKVGIEK